MPASPWFRVIASALGLLLCLATCGCQQQTAQSAVTGPSTATIQKDLRERIDHVLDHARGQRHMSTKDQAAWQVVHGMLAFGSDLKIYHDGKLVSAFDYLAAGGQMKGWNLRKGDKGLEAILESGTKSGQGHEDQWIGYLSLRNIPAETPLLVSGQQYTLRDLVTQAQYDIYDGMEASWTLMAASTYLPLDAKWTARDGKEWTIDRIVLMEANTDINESACGGTHRLTALATALNRYKASGGKVPETPGGAWYAADEMIENCIATARAYQQPDGSFSTAYFKRAATSADIGERLGTTGHTLEFLMVALDDAAIREEWITRAVNSLVTNFEKTEDYDLECGALYHAARGLDLYRTRRFGLRETAK